MKKQLLAIAVTVIGFAAWSADNLITNSSFEDGAADWKFSSMKGKVKNLERSTQVNKGDEAITMSLEVPDKNDLIGNKHGACGRIHKALTLTPGKTYQVKAFAYPDKNYDGIIDILVKAGEGTGTRHFGGDGQAYGKWQEISGEFTATAPEAMVFLYAMGNRGEVSFDDVEL
ncbi:MAG: carbohydrate binding domain-containing protein, partial [Phycisphaerae bacterium]